MKRNKSHLKKVVVVLLVLIVTALGYYVLPRVGKHDVERALDAYGQSDS